MRRGEVEAIALRRGLETEVFSASAKRSELTGDIRASPAHPCLMSCGYRGRRPAFVAMEAGSSWDCSRCAVYALAAGVLSASRTRRIVLEAW
jgi:hypothetical protein